MILKSVQITYFKHILDSTWIEIQPDITCLVGKNESGKTTFLEALRCLNPEQSEVKFDINRHYPAWLAKEHEKEGDLNTVYPITCRFELEDDDVKAIESVFGEKIMISRTYIFARRYNNTSSFNYDIDEKIAVLNALAGIELSKKVSDAVKLAKTFQEVKVKIEKLDADNEGDPQITSTTNTIRGVIERLLPENISFRQQIFKILRKRVPKFFFFSKYSQLPERVNIRELLEANPEELDENHKTALSLLNLARAKKESILSQDYDTRQRELDNINKSITQNFLKYWTTNEELRVKININTSPNAGNMPDEMHVWMWDDRYGLSLPLDERSSGFQWFFSFLAAFSHYENDDTPVIILLDDPALNLHAKAQSDFLNFIENHLSKRCQVIYTTHSPFMIQPNHLERTRLVEDKGQEHGSVITSNVLTTDRDTLFPLQAALGYDIAQHLFISKNNLVVEGPSDFLFMQIISERLIENGREGLSEHWSIIPLGGVDTIPAFVALLGNHLNVTVIVDSHKKGHQKLSALADAGFLEKECIITIGEVADRKKADIEDLFAKDDYVDLYNAAFNKNIKVTDLDGDGPIVRQIERKESGKRYNHTAPANILLRTPTEGMAALSDETLDSFEKLFKRINTTLSS